jgi:hypothetical protein
MAELSCSLARGVGVPAVTSRRSDSCRTRSAPASHISAGECASEGTARSVPLEATRAACEAIMQASGDVRACARVGKLRGPT